MRRAAPSATRAAHRLGWLLLCVTFAACASESETETAASSSGTPAAEPAPSAYVVRLDSDRSDPGQFQLTEEGPALRILTGPAGIAYRAEDAVQSGDFRVDATFTQYGAPVGYREAYGLFLGGLELDGPELEYTYLLVRPTGDFLIKRRIGEITETIVDWTPHTAIRVVAAEGDEPENTVTVEVADGQLNFILNGQLAHSMLATEARPFGITGLRANHRLDVRVTNWTLAISATR